MSRREPRTRQIAPALAAATLLAVLGLGCGAGNPDRDTGAGSGARASATGACSDHATQAEAQRAADTRDADGDGVYCESLPCPCSPQAGGGRTSPTTEDRGTTSSVAQPSSTPPGDVIRGVVTKPVDGDTIKVRPNGTGKATTVRLIGIDTPETKRPQTPVECGGPQASAYTKRFAGPGTPVTLRTDPTQDRTDRYGRLLAEVSTPRGSVQQRLVAAGLAKVYVYGGTRFRRYPQLAAAQRRAKAADRGSWARCDGDFHRPR